MALPNVSGVQQAGVNPQSVQKQNDNSQAVANALREVQSRLDNIMNVRGNIQAGVFGAFGNNFLSRGMIGITDAIADSIGALFGEKEEEREDPVSKALKEQTAVLREVATNVSTGSKLSERVTDEITLLRRDIKHSQELQHADTLDQDKILEQILETLSGTSRVSPVDQDLSDEAFTRVVDSLQGLSDQNNDAKAFEKVVDDLKSVADKQTSAEALDVESRDIDTDQKELNQAEKQSTLLGKIFASLTSISKNLDKLVKSQPMSTRESELEAMRVKRDQLEQRTGVEDIKTVDDGGKRGFDWTRLFTGLLDFDANLRGLKNIFGSLGKIIQPIISAFSGLLKYIVPLGRAMLSIAGPLAIAAAPLAAMFGVKQWAENASIFDEKGEMTTTGKVLDTAQKVLGNEQGLKPLSEMTSVQRIESEGDTGFLGLRTSARDAHKKKYLEKIQLGAKFTAEEAEALKRVFDIDVPLANISKVLDSGLAQIEVTQEDIRKAERLKEAQRSAGSGAAPVIQDNRVTQNQTIMPTRTVVENPEPAYRRYVNNILQPAR